MGALLAALGTKLGGAALAEGVAAGTTLGSGIGLKATTSALLPSFGSLTPAVSPLVTGATLPGVASLIPSSTALLPGGLASLGGGGGSLLAGSSLLAPAAAGLSALTPPASALLPNLSALNLPAGSLLKGGADLATASKFGLLDPASKVGLKMPNQLIQAPTTDIAKLPTEVAPDLIRSDYLTKQAGLGGSDALKAQGKAAQDYYNFVDRQAQIASDAARSQKMAVEAGLASPIEPGKNFMTNAMNLFQNPSVDAAIDYAKEHPYATAAGAYGLANLMQPKYNPPAVDRGRIRPYEYSIEQRPEAYAAAPGDSSEQRYFDTRMKELPSYAAKEGGLMGLAAGGAVEQMSQSNALGTNTGYPMSQINSPFYSNPTAQRPEAVNSMLSTGDTPVGAYTGEKRFAMGGILNPFSGQSQATPQTTGGYSYSYDPSTNEFTQLSAPKPAPTSNFYNPLFGGRNYYTDPFGVPQYQVAQTTPTKPEISGGIVGVSGTPQQTYTPPPYRETTLPDLGPPVPYQSPTQRLGLGDFYSMMDERLKQQASNLPISYARGGGIASLRGQSDLGDYSDGGRLLKGPGDGVSDSIPAVIGNRQPARLADGEFVIPARIVSEIGNGSTDAGARKLYAMMDRVQKARRNTVGKGKIAANTKADKHLPA